MGGLTGMTTPAQPGTPPPIAALVWLAERPGACVGTRQLVGLFPDDTAAMEACKKSAASDGSGPLDWEEAVGGWVARNRRFPRMAAAAWTITRHEIAGGLAVLLHALRPRDLAAAIAALGQDHFDAVCEAVRFAEDVACFGEAEARALDEGRL